MGRASTSVGSARSAYVLELARGCSYIGSALTPDTRNRAITEVVVGFRQLYGDRELPLFQKLLAEGLQRRGKPDAASDVLEFKLLVP